MINHYDVPISAVLLDLDGTVYVEGHLIAGAQESIDWLISHDIQIRFLTNTTAKNREQVKERLSKLGMSIPDNWIFTPCVSACQWLKNQSFRKGVFTLVHSNLHSDLSCLPLTDDENADIVLMGDMGDEWNIDRLNQALRCLLNGATLVALQRNRYWKTHQGLQLDVGAFVSALEYSSGQLCNVVFGKPNKLFFEMAVNSMAVKAPGVLMVGDDLESDILGAQNCGVRGILVRTGKYQQADWLDRVDQAHAIMDSIRDLPRLIRHAILDKSDRRGC